ncbi:MAG TPA: MarR family transcriptional regulator [Solirubrobacteraceae bacterium]|nr:MarR family transcriptional regulator [Solirubrobacteraceae bacterium]
MSTVTAVKIASSHSPSPVPGRCGDDAEQETLTLGELRAWRGLLRAHACLAKRLDAELEREHGLPMTSYEVLRHLEDANGGRMRMCELAEQAQLSRSGLTRLVDRLERDGLIERCSCDHDARGSYACMTHAGRERLEAARGTHLAVMREQFFSHFSETELGSLADMWERIAPCSGY